MRSASPHRARTQAGQLVRPRQNSGMPITRNPCEGLAAALVLCPADFPDRVDEHRAGFQPEHRGNGGQADGLHEFHRAGRDVGEQRPRGVAPAPAPRSRCSASAGRRCRPRRLRGRSRAPGHGWSAVFMLPERMAYLKPLLGVAPRPACTQLAAPACAELQEICCRIDADGRPTAATNLGVSNLLHDDARGMLYIGTHADLDASAWAQISLLYGPNHRRVNTTRHQACLAVMQTIPNCK